MARVAPSVTARVCSKTPSPHTHSRKTAAVLGLLALGLVILGLTFTPSPGSPTLKVVPASKVVTMAAKGAKCESGTPSGLTQVNATHYEYRLVQRRCSPCFRLCAWGGPAPQPTLARAPSRRPVPLRSEATLGKAGGGMEGRAGVRLLCSNGCLCVISAAGVLSCGVCV